MSDLAFPFIAVKSTLAAVQRRQVDHALAPIPVSTDEAKGQNEQLVNESP
jgi:hypothetical protein